MLGGNTLLHGREDPLEGNSRYETIRWATPDKPNVQVALDRQRNVNVAVKFIKRGHSVSKHVRREILHHHSLQHPHVVQFYEAFLTPKYLCIVMELGEQSLWQYVRGQGGILPEEMARGFFCQLLLGLEYCHGVGVANRDIKLENAVLQARFHCGQQYHMLKVCDFGYCQHSRKDSDADSLVGTSPYVSPEVLHQQSYNAKLADIWSCAVVLYFLIEGRFPFGTEVTEGSMEKLFERILSFRYDPPRIMSPGAKDLIIKMLVPAEQRVNFCGVREHWWLKHGLLEYDKKFGSMQNPMFTAHQTEAELEVIVEEAKVPLSGSIEPGRLEQIILEATLGDPDDVDMFDEHMAPR